jgi:hypothetical protein
MGSNVSTEKLYIYCGPVSVVLLFVGMAVARLLPLPSPTAGADQIAAFFTEHTIAIRYGVLICLFGIALLTPWLAVYAKQFKRIEGPNSVSAYVQLAFAPMLVLEVIFPLTFLEVAVFRPDRSPSEMQLLSDLCWIPFTGVIFTYVFEIAFAGFVILRDQRANPIFPRWVGYFDLATAALAVPSCLAYTLQTGPFAWNGAVAFWMIAASYGSWVLVMSHVMLKVADRPEPGVELTLMPAEAGPAPQFAPLGVGQK